MTTSHRVTTPVVGDRVVFRCDGNDQIGAGHVARCLPLAQAFAQLGWTVSFVGAYEGLARWLLAQAAIDTRLPHPEASCGIAEGWCEAAVLDSYLIAPASVCALAHRLPVVTVAESNRCPTHGVLLDYHLDRTEPSSARLLAGASFAPLDPAFAGAGRASREIDRVLVTMGGSIRAHKLLDPITQTVGLVFANADIIVAGGLKSETIQRIGPRLIQLPSPSALVDVVGDVDVAVTAAGWTAYELACAGIPLVAIAIVDNQQRVVKGFDKRGLAPCIDLSAGDSLAELPTALKRLEDPGLRLRLAERGMRALDGQGAKRAAIALTERYRRTSTS